MIPARFTYLGEATGECDAAGYVFKRTWRWRIWIIFFRLGLIRLTEANTCWWL